jgi:hypothetical protein
VSCLETQWGGEGEGRFANQLLAASRCRPDRRADVLGFLEGIKEMFVDGEVLKVSPFKRPEKRSVVQCSLPMMRLILVCGCIRHD